MDLHAAIALNRFGLGHRRDEAAPDDPKAWLRAQVINPDPAVFAGLPSAEQALDILFALTREDRDLAARYHGNAEGVDRPALKAFQRLLPEERRALLANALTTTAPFRERLVWFWANHFTVAAKTRPTIATCGPYVREAIRPHVTGKFADMLLAVMRHPTMLGYLDNAQSVGPNSEFGQRRGRGLNENLARECLELHTVTPASGYTQEDVTNFARVLTGWTFIWQKEPRGFMFRAAAHEPGQFEVMGHSWPEGEEGGVALLTWLANHPATQRNIATKLVRHFTADEPRASDVAIIAAVLRNTGGDLGQAALALLELDSAWQPLTKLRTPQEYVVAVMRAVGAHPEFEGGLPGQVAGLGQGLWMAPFPIGWPDRAADWAGPEAVLQRIDFAYQFAGRVGDVDPAALADATLGPLLSAETLAQIRGAGSRQDGLTLLFACPEFQRR